MASEPGHRKLMTIAAAAAYADVHPVTLRRWVAAGRLPAYRVGPRLLKVDQAELDSVVRPLPVTSTRLP
jgi:excisionase family DNA binding protein